MEGRKKSLPVWAIILIILVALALIGAGVYVAVKNRTNNGDSKTSGTPTSEEQKKIDAEAKERTGGDLGVKAKELANSGKAEEGLALLKKQADSETDKKQKSRYLHAAALLAINNDLYQQSYAYATESYSLNPTQSDAQIAGEAAYQLKDKENSIKYFELALTYWTPERKKNEADFYADEEANVTKAKNL